MTNEFEGKASYECKVAVLVLAYLFEKYRRSIGFETLQVPVLIRRTDGEIVETGDTRSVQVERFDLACIELIQAITHEEFEEARRIVEQRLNEEQNVQG
jgi:hypothetical protein